MDMMDRYVELIRQATWFASAGFITAAAEKELDAMMILACIANSPLDREAVRDGLRA